ncbi:hypothetical protein DPX16_22241 [Anabarilius grahami]|uniref:Uncharacterized protein n=1 Tax=Anabarilius grahami TaxID=495550 RepID=A0A3N0XNS2_ANAGA|nr:hypothetical protein DPX16_22241 [Anabarilius grahami]
MSFRHEEAFWATIVNYKREKYERKENGGDYSLPVPTHVDYAVKVKSLPLRICEQDSQEDSALQILTYDSIEAWTIREIPSPNVTLPLKKAQREDRYQSKMHLNASAIICLHWYDES